MDSDFQICKKKRKHVTIDKKEELLRHSSSYHYTLWASLSQLQNRYINMNQPIRYRKNYLSIIPIILGIVPLIWTAITVITGKPFENYPSLKFSIGIIGLCFWAILILCIIIYTIKKPYALILDSHGFQSYTDYNSGQQIIGRISII